jgi:hypothetical protein
MELVRKVLARLGDLPVKPDRFLVRRPPLLPVRQQPGTYILSSSSSMQPCPRLQ